MTEASTAVITWPEANDLALCASVSPFIKLGVIMIIRILPSTVVKI